MYRTLDRYDEITTDHSKTSYYKACVMLMDDEICGDLHHLLAPCADRVFLEAYCEAHAKKFSENFDV